MIRLNINRTKISASCLETLVEGNVNSIFAAFEFSSEWDDLGRVAVFSNGTSKISVILSENNCAIPWEMFSCPGELIVAVRGVGDSGNLVICTENASLGKVIESIADDDSDEPEEASPDVIDALLADVADLKSGILTGEGGHTPVKGTDYWTDEDKAEIISEIEQAMSSVFASKTDLTNKQDRISDLATIRSGAALGTTSVQPEVGKGLFSGRYNDLSNKPTIPIVPTKVSAFTNDSNYQTASQMANAINTREKVGKITVDFYERDVVGHEVIIVTNGVSSTFNLVGWTGGPA